MALTPTIMTQWAVNGERAPRQRAGEDGAE